MQKNGRNLVHFAHAFLKNPSKVGSVVPSSQYLARAIARTAAAHLPRGGMLVEVGPGEGAVTRALLTEDLHSGRILAIEASEKLCQVLRMKFKSDISSGRLCVSCDDAAHITNILESSSERRADVIVSSLPFLSLGEAKSREVLQACVDALSDNGKFIAFQYTPLMGKIFDEYFAVIETQIVFRNLPPALVYLCEKRVI